jgi:hypothetical protein
MAHTEIPTTATADETMQVEEPRALLAEGLWSLSSTTQG